MKVDETAIAAITAKITRADQHFRALYREMAAWDTRKPWRLIPETHNNGTRHFYRLKLLEPIPVEWSVTLGEAVHDLRSALEQAVYWLSVDWTGAEVEGCSFPVYTSRSDYFRAARKHPTGWAPNGGFYKVRGLGQGPQAFIEALQPYPQRRGFYCWDLRAVHDLWNQDKHRLVHLWGLRFGDEKLSLEKPLDVVCQLGIDRRVLHDGAIVLKAVCTCPTEQVKVKGQIGATLAFAAGRRRKGGRQSLWNIGSTVADIVGKLLGAIGHQDRTISTAVWSAKYDF